MKKILSISLAVLSLQTAIAQESKPDTIKVGNFIIVKDKKAQGDDNIESKSKNDEFFTIKKNKKKPSNVSTNWWILDIGLANFRDQSDYTAARNSGYLRTIRPGDAPLTQNDLKIRTGKTTNVNLWFFMQKLNVSKHVLNLKYGLGLEMYNIRYENNISFSKNPTYIYRDTVAFNKNKFYAGYITAPIMINIKPFPTKKSLSISAGVSAGYLVGSRSKQKSDARGKVKSKGDFDLEPWRLAYVGELGLGPVRLFGSYSVNKFHKNGLEQYPYSVGIRFSNW